LPSGASLHSYSFSPFRAGNGPFLPHSGPPAPARPGVAIAPRRMPAQPSGSRIEEPLGRLTFLDVRWGHECCQRSAVRSTPLYPPETIFSERDQCRSVAVANGDEATDDADISGLLVRAEIDRRVMVIVEEAGAAQPLEYRLAALEVDGGQVPSSGIARPRSTAGIRILGVRCR